MILSAHQPAYIPWLGYFDKIVRSDVFIYLDTVQFEKNSFVNRNQIKTPQGAAWLSIPVKTKGHLNKALVDIEIDNSQNWSKKHLNSVFLNYKKAPRFEECYAKLQELFQKEYRLLADLCWDQLDFWLKEIGIETKIVRLSDLSLKAKGSELILEICKHFEANYYLSGVLGKNYLKENDFRSAGISVEYQEYKQPIYPQLWGSEFLNYMSIIDFWMNTDKYSLITERKTSP